jgi:hypothetical protein
MFPKLPSCADALHKTSAAAGRFDPAFRFTLSENARKCPIGGDDLNCARN